ncbi:histidinol dehydrogenase, chloroplastic-like [Mangifera indica]|uniref:histidinol dehydrogenase, chloroplastic-like n=1 Tax=Mangifera indica TaxID=29780 RepID=UPI001CFA14D2|nr:histidinol dehydrogenase, chloroplastic-like [Mangifera indica]
MDERTPSTPCIEYSAALWAWLEGRGMYCIVPRKLEEERFECVKQSSYVAISDMVWGTELAQRYESSVEKIFGPGNQYATAAKMILQNSGARISIDMPAAPSEVLVIADKYACPVHIAADLLSQLAEHEPDSQVVLVIGGDGIDLRAIEEEIRKQCQDLPRGEFASKPRSHSYTVFARDMMEVK